MIIASHYCFYKDLLSCQPSGKEASADFIKDQLKKHFIEMDESTAKALQLMGAPSYISAIQIQMISLQYKVLLHPVSCADFIAILHSTLLESLPNLTG